MSDSMKAKWQEPGYRERTVAAKGGLPRVYGYGWRVRRREVLTRANGTCEKCKRVPPKHVHHVLPIRLFADLNEAHFLSNLEALCESCHRVAHRKLAVTAPLLDRIERQR